MDAINVGVLANDGTGDDLRTAFVKINQNFAELDARQPESTTAANIGSGVGIFANNNSGELQFKSIAGSNIEIESTADTVTLTASPGLQALVVNADTGAINFVSSSELTVRGAGNTITSVDSGELVIASVTKLASDPAPTMTADLDASDYNINNAATITATNVIGLVHSIDIRDINKYAVGFDFGGVVQPVQGILDVIAATTPVDFGSIAQPSALQLDAGLV